MPTTGSAIGSTPFGMGTPAAVADPPRRPTNLTRYIDPQTRDFVIDEEAREFKRMGKTKQRVFLALLTLKGSSPAMPNFGTLLPAKIGPDTTRRVQASVRDSLRHLVRDGSLAIRRITVDLAGNSNSHLIVAVEYIDLVTGEPDRLATEI